MGCGWPVSFENVVVFSCAHKNTTQQDSQAFFLVPFCVVPLVQLKSSAAMQIDESIESLKAALLELSLSNENYSIPPLFTDRLVLARPSYTYILALAKFFTQKKQSLRWKELLFPNDDVNDTIDHSASSLTRKEQLTILSRLLAVVSHVGGQRFDIFVSPSKILCGQDVILTHEFLRAMARSVAAPDESMAEAVRYVLEAGDAHVYRRGVRTRKAFTCLQAICRGWLVRRKVNGSENEDECSSSDSDGKDGCSSIIRAKQATTASMCKPPSSDFDEQALLESFNDILLHKAKVEGELFPFSGNIDFHLKVLTQ